MNKQPLDEVQITRNPFMVVESDQNKLPDGALMRVEGQFGFMERENLNGRTYTKELWRKVLGSTDVQERIRKRSMFGEADHPEGMETSLNRVSHIVTRLWLDENQNLVMGSADILDTPSGRILATLFRYGAEVGVSSRGAGAIVEKDGKQIVDPDSYEYVTHDFVTDPSNPGSNPKPVMESVADKQAALNSLQGLLEKDYKLYVTKKEEGFYKALYENLGVDFDSVAATQSEQKEPTVEDKKPGLDTETLLGRIDEMAQQLSALARQTEERTESLLDKDALIEALRKQNAGLRTQVEQKTKRLELAEGQLPMLKTLQNQLDEANTIRTRLEKRLESVTKRLSTVRAMKDKITERVKSDSAQHEQALKQAEGRATRTQKRFDEVRAELEELRRTRVTERKATSPAPVRVRTERPAPGGSRIGKPLGAAKVESHEVHEDDPVETRQLSILATMSEGMFNDLPTLEE